MKKIGAAPTGTRDGQPLYTAPTIVDPSTGAIVTDSINIALYLDKQYPSTQKLFPDGSHALQAAFIETEATRLLYAMFPLCVLDIHNQFTPRAQEWFRASREKMFGGAKLEAVVPQGKKREEAIKALLAVLDDITRWIEEGGEKGLFIGGDKPTHADTAIAAILTTIERTSNGESDVWKAIVAANGGRWGRFFKAFEQWASVAQ
ncbi:hypothetical protein OF83DRAFT_1134039 [Amylostereum chailletii]|nr:hypothetical protein OF83DRAFT_1134039 [Amylostereum chailletii]